MSTFTSAPGVFNDELIADTALFVSSGSTRNVRILNLDPLSSYDITLYGSREAGDTRVTTYSVIGDITVGGALTTSGTDIGSGNEDYNNNNVLAFNALSPDGSGIITIEHTGTTGSFGYLNALTITAIPEPTGFVILGVILVGLLYIRRSRRQALPGH